MIRVNVTIRRESPVNSYLCTFIDIYDGRNVQNYVRELYPGWIIIRIWTDGDTERHETLINDPEWHICVYECDK